MDDPQVQEENPKSLAVTHSDIESASKDKAESSHLDGEGPNSKEGTNEASDAERVNTNAAVVSIPKAFYCPLSQKVFCDPVVATDGITYERSAVSTADQNGKGDEETPLEDQPRLYSNRSIKTIIEEQIKSRGQRRRWSQLPSWVGTNDRPLSDGFYCPMTLNLIHEPVIDPEGYSFEKVAIESWIQVNGASPVTRQKVALEDLRPNKTLAQLMEDEANTTKLLDEQNTTTHPAWKQWKEEGPPVVPTLLNQNSETNGATARRPFPMTPQELEAANRARLIHRYKKLHIFTMLFLLLALGAWLIPSFATILLIVILLGIVLVTVFSSNNDNF